MQFLQRNHTKQSHFQKSKLGGKTLSGAHVHWACSGCPAHFSTLRIKQWQNQVPVFMMLIFKWGKQTLTKEQQESVSIKGAQETRRTGCRNLGSSPDWSTAPGENSAWTCGDSDLRYKLNINQKNRDTCTWKSKLTCKDGEAPSEMEDTEEEQVWWIGENTVVSFRHSAFQMPRKYASEHVKEA